MSGLLGHSGRTGNLGQIGSGEILVQDHVVTSAAGIVNVAPVTSRLALPYTDAT